MNSIMESIFSKSKSLSKEEQNYYIKKYQETKKQKYKDIILGSIYRFIYAEANRYKNVKNNSVDELFEEGVYGAIVALEKFDTTKNLVFITYAVWYIKKYIKMYMYDNYNGQIRMSKERVVKAMKSKTAGESSAYITTIIDKNGDELDIFDTIEQNIFNINELEEESLVSFAIDKINDVLSNFPKRDRDFFLEHNKENTSFLDCAEKYRMSKSTALTIDKRFKCIISSHFSEDMSVQLQF